MVVPAPFEPISPAITPAARARPLVGRLSDEGRLVHPSVTRRLIDEFAARTRAPPPSDGLDVLTNREREVMAWSPRACNEAIAARLVVSVAPGRT